MKHATMVAAATLLALAGTAQCQLAVNGRLKPQYGPAVWFNTAPTGFGDSTTEFPPPNPCICTPVGASLVVALDNSNRGGVTGDSLNPGTADAANVATGYEIRLKLSDLGIPDSGPAPASIRIAGFISSGNTLFMSNQVIGGLSGANNLGNSRNVNFSTLPNNQFITVPVEAATVAAPAIDGVRDAFYAAADPSASFVQDTFTQFGNATGAAANIYDASGSELDNAVARIVTVGGERTLFLFLGGNLERNFNKFMLFFDTGAAGGQNTISTDGCQGFGIFDPVVRLGPCTGGCDGNPGPGLTFDAAFAANYYIQLRTGNVNNIGNQFADFGRLAASVSDRGWARNISQTGQNTNPGAPANLGNVLVAAADPCPPTTDTPATDYAAGSEINGLYSAVCTEGGQQFLYLLVTGNIQNNGNRLDLFVDAGTANIGTRDVPNIPSVGQNRLLNFNSRVDNGGLNRYGEFVPAPTPDVPNPAAQPGLRFSTGFNADYWLSVRNQGESSPELGTWAARINTGGAVNDGNTPSNLFEFASFRFAPKSFPTPLVFDGLGCVRTAATSSACATLIGADCAPNGAGTVFNPANIVGIDIQGDLFAGNALSGCVITEPFSSFAPRLISRDVFNPLGTSPASTSLAVPGLLSINLDNSNRAGVTGLGDADAAQSAARARRVTSGIEVKVRLDELGWDGVSPIRVSGWITSSGHDFISNQVIGNADAALANLGDPSLVDFQAGPLAAGTFFVTVVPGSCADAATAACCFDASACSVMSQAQCSAAGGTWTPTQAACSPTSCAVSSTVVCCRGVTCVVVADAAACTAPAGVGIRSFTGTTCAGQSAINAGCCYADFNKSGAKDVADIFAFLSAWFANSPFSDVGGDGTGTRDVSDIFQFLSAWFVGCS